MLSKKQFVALSNFRCQLTRFQRCSEQVSKESGVTLTQYLLLLHIRGFPNRDWATVGELATRLSASPHGTVALINRCVALDLVIKHRSTADAREVEVHLTPYGEELVLRIAGYHREEFKFLRDVMRLAHVD